MTQLEKCTPTKCSKSIRYIKRMLFLQDSKNSIIFMIRASLKTLFIKNVNFETKLHLICLIDHQVQAEAWFFLRSIGVNPNKLYVWMGLSLKNTNLALDSLWCTACWKSDIMKLSTFLGKKSKFDQPNSAKMFYDLPIPVSQK